MRRKEKKLTLQQKPGGRRLSVFAVPAFICTFIRLGEIEDGHVTCRGGPHQKSVFEKVCRAGAGVISFTVQGHLSALHHRSARTVQNQKRTWRSTQTSELKAGICFLYRCLTGRPSGGTGAPQPYRFWSLKRVKIQMINEIRLERRRERW